MQKLVAIYNDVKNDLPLFLDLYDLIKKERISKPQISELLKTLNRLLDLRRWWICITTTYGTALKENKTRKGNRGQEEKTTSLVHFC